LLAEAFDDGPVMNDFVIDVDRSAEQFESAFQALDRHINAGAKAARIRQNYLHVHLRCGCPYPKSRAGKGKDELRGATAKFW
jgi:hypothetical protein